MLPALRKCELYTVCATFFYNGLYSVSVSYIRLENDDAITLYLLLVILILCSFGIMGQCWQMEPRDRPTFKEICSTLSKLIECEAGYLQFGFNPFTDGGEEGVGEVEGGEEGRRNIEDEEEEEEREFI